MDVKSQLYPLKKVLQSTRGGALLLEPSPPRNVPIRCLRFDEGKMPVKRQASFDEGKMPVKRQASSFTFPLA